MRERPRGRRDLEKLRRCVCASVVCFAGLASSSAASVSSMRSLLASLLVLQRDEKWQENNESTCLLLPQHPRRDERQQRPVGIGVGVVRAGRSAAALVGWLVGW